MKMTILQKKSSRRNVFFGTNLDFINHPLQDFWNFPPTFPKYFQIFSQISIFGEFRYLCLKFGTFSINIHGEKCFQSCTLFDSFFNFPIVHCNSAFLQTTNLERIHQNIFCARGFLGDPRGAVK